MLQKPERVKNAIILTAKTAQTDLCTKFDTKKVEIELDFEPLHPLVRTTVQFRGQTNNSNSK